MKSTRTLALAATAIMLASACSPPNSDGAGNGGNEDIDTSEVVLGIPNDVSGREWDPALTAGGTAVPVLYSIYDTLYDFDEEGLPQPHVVESDELSDDEKTLTLSIRDDLTFHDGSALTADDVAFSLDRVRGEDEDLEGPAYASSLAAVDSVEVVDDYTVAIHLSEPDPVLRNSLAYLPGMVLPSDYVQEVGNDGFLSEPVGSGPYALETATPGQQYTLSAFEDYSFEPAGSFEQVNLQVLTEEATRIAQLRAGDIDFAVDVDISQVDSLEGDGYQVTTNPSGQFLSVIFNHQTEALQDPQVREAINLAIDRESIAESLYDGLASEIGTMDANISAEQVEPFDYDPERAEQLLEESDYAGETLVINYPSGRYPQDSRLVQTIQASLAEVGMDVEIRSMDSNQWLDGLQENTLDDMTLTILSNTNYDSYQSLWSATACEGPWSLWCDEDLEAELERLAQLSDEERQQGFVELSESFKEDPPALFLLDFHQVYAMQDGFQWHPTSGYRNFDYTDIRPE